MNNLISLIYQNVVKRSETFSVSALLRDDGPRPTQKSPISNQSFDSFRGSAAISANATYPHSIYEQNMLHHRPLFHTFPWLAAVAFHQGQQPTATPNGSAASAPNSYGAPPIGHEELMRFRSLMSQSQLPGGPNAAAAAAAHLNFAQHQHHLHHHHLFMRPGIPSLGDVYSCVKCEKMFSTPHGLEVHSRRSHNGKSKKKKTKISSRRF